MNARVVVSLKPSVLDPQGQAISRALASLGFSEVTDVRLGKVIELELNEADPARARARLSSMCEKLLANPVIEEFRIELDRRAEGASDRGPLGGESPAAGQGA
jgi:phosphoribosylformylglycinamidine synthase PurS subunit